jgi:hypothetical protein
MKMDGTLQRTMPHHHARKRLVAPAVADQRIVGEPVNDGFDGVGDQLAREQGELHPFVVHADAVGHRHGREFTRRPAGFLDAGFGCRHLEIVRHVAGRLLALHADDAHHRPRDRSVVEAHRAHERAMGRPVEPVRRDA